MSERTHATGLAYRPDGRKTFTVYVLEKPGIVTAVLCDESDARLYAASPDLLATLQKIASGTEDAVPPFRAMSAEQMRRIASDAIAKSGVPT